MESSDDDNERDYSDSSSNGQSERTTRNTKHISKKQRSRTASGTAGSNQAATVSANQVTSRFLKKRKKLTKGKKMAERQMENGLTNANSEMNIVQPGDKVVVETLVTHSEGRFGSNGEVYSI